MTRINPSNERLKRDYVRYLKNAKGLSEATIDATRKAIRRFEDYTGCKDFKTFRREQAIGFKDRLAETVGIRSGERLSYPTLATTLAALREFFTWVAQQPGYKSRIVLSDIDYLRLSLKDEAKAKASKIPRFPTLEQIRAAIEAAPTGTIIDRRNRALIAFAILTGMRDRAMVSLSLRHIDLTRSPPLVRQEPDSVKTKFSKTITTYFFPLGDDLDAIIREWVGELRIDRSFGPSDPVFPRTRVVHAAGSGFASHGIEAVHWSDAAAVRAIFKDAFARAGLPYFPPHSFRHTLGHLMQTVCNTPEQIKAWSQNLGHEHVATTLTSYGRIDPYRQGEIIAGISLTPGLCEVEILNQIRVMIDQSRRDDAR